MTKTYAQALALVATITEAVPLTVNDKLTYAARTLLARLKVVMDPVAAAYAEAVRDNKVTYAATDVDGLILTETLTITNPPLTLYRYTIDGQNGLNDANDAALFTANATEVTFTPYISVDCPRIAEMDEYLREQLYGILIEEPVEV